MTQKEKTIEAIKLLIKKYKWLIENAHQINMLGQIAIVDECFSIVSSETIQRIKRDKKEKWFFHKGIYNPSRKCPLCEIHVSFKGVHWPENGDGLTANQHIALQRKKSEKEWKN